MKSCSRCLLSTEVPGVQIGEGGICTVCDDYDKTWGDWESQKESRGRDLEKLLEQVRRRKRDYDVVVPLSGGKDSTYVLYVCRKILNLKCLAVTFENGFLTDHARVNIGKACEILGADHIYYGLNRPLMMRLYRHVFLKTGFFCPVCMRGISTAIYRIQQAFGIPLAIKGTSRRTEEHVDRAYFLDGNISFLENVLQGTPLSAEADLLLSVTGVFSSPPAIKLPDYMDWDYDQIYSTITTELGWTAHDKRAEHSDCAVDNIVHYIRYRKFPALVPEMLRLSKLVTCGQLDRQEAEKEVARRQATFSEPSNLQYFLDALDITRDEMEEVLADPKRHFQYLRQRNRIARRLKAITRRLGWRR
jgi:predicted PP-loop superfamily ATPase